jgi:hypothetical protein
MDVSYGSQARRLPKMVQSLFPAPSGLLDIEREKDQAQAPPTHCPAMTLSGGLVLTVFVPLSSPLSGTSRLG